MATDPLRPTRFKILDDLGEEEVFGLYIELGTVLQLMDSLFEPHSGERPGAEEFYIWLRQYAERRERWQQAEQTRGSIDADEAVAIAMEAIEENHRSSKLRVDTLKRRSSKQNRVEHGDHNTLEVSGGKSLGQQSLEALIEAESIYTPPSIFPPPDEE